MTFLYSQTFSEFNRKQELVYSSVAQYIIVKYNISYDIVAY